MNEEAFPSQSSKILPIERKQAISSFAQFLQAQHTLYPCYILFPAFPPQYQAINEHILLCP